MTVALDDHVTPHFTWRELLHSPTAERDPGLRAAQLAPPDDVVSNLIYLAETVLEPVRAALGVPVFVTSGYRCPELNLRIGSSDRSQHPKGEAADLELFLAAGRFRELRSRLEPQLGGRALSPNGALFGLIASDLQRLDVDQLIHEYGERGRPAWVHVAASRRQNRRQILAVGEYTGGRYTKLERDEALAWVTGGAG